MEDLSIIIPAYNEERAIKNVVEELIKECPKAEIIVVDDGSKDKTFQSLEGLPIKLIKNKENRGYGYSIRQGVLNSSKTKGILFDADGQHRVEDLKKIYEGLENYDMVIGVRNKKSHVVKRRWLSKKILATVVHFIIGKRFPDFNSGLRGFNSKILSKYLHLLPNGFSASTTMTVVFYHRGYDVGEVSIKTKKRLGKSSVRQFRDGLNTILLVVRLLALFNPLRIFLPVSLIILTFGFCWGGVYLFSGFGLSVGALFFLLSGILFFLFGILADQVSQLRLEQFERKNVRNNGNI